MDYLIWAFQLYASYFLTVLKIGSVILVLAYLGFTIRDR